MPRHQMVTRRITAYVRIAVGACVLALVVPPGAHAAAHVDVGANVAPADMARMMEMLKAQQQRIEALEQALAETRSQTGSTATRLAVTEERLDLTAEVVDDLQSGSGARIDSSSWFERTRVGGYGELHYNNLDAEDSNRDLKEADFHRFVLFVNHEFNDRMRFFSEWEIEHALVKDTADGSSGGEVEIEQAFIEYDLDARHQARTGLMLLPIGLLNETHEPDTFYGVERNDVENVIVPTTWWEAGVGIGGRYGNGLSWDLVGHTGLAMPTTGSSAFRVRSGRQKVSNAVAEDLAVTGRIKYTGIPGLELAASLQYQGDVSQASGDGLEDGLLLETHVAYRRGGFGLRALYARWDFDGSLVKAAGADEQEGWYVEPSYRFANIDLPFGGDVGVYARYQDVEGARTQDRFNQWEAGVNYWPAPRVVLKLDYRDRQHARSAARGRDFNGIDLGIGYSF